MKQVTKFLTLNAIAWCVAVNASQDGSKALVTMNGKPLITQQQLNQLFDRHSKDYPLFTFWNDSDGDLQKKLDRFLEIMVRQAVINKYVHDHKMDTSPAYQQELREYTYNIKADSNNAVGKSPQEIQKEIDSHTWYLNNKYFAQQVPMPLDASDAEIQQAYDKIQHNYVGDVFEALKENLRQQVTEEKHRNNVDTEIERLQKEYKIAVIAKPS